MPTKYGSTYPDEWWDCPDWRRFFTYEINGVEETTFQRSEIGVEGECDVVFANFDGVVHWKWSENSTSWKVAHQLDHIQPLHDKVIFADGEVDPSEYLVDATTRWTRFVIEEGVKFTGPNRCLNDITGASGPSILANRPVPIAADYVCWGVTEALSTFAGTRDVPIYTPWSCRHRVNTELDIVYFAAHIPEPSEAGSSTI